MADPITSFAGRRVLVTGGSMGIGAAVSQELARRGVPVLVAARGADAVRETVDALPGEGHGGLTLNVSDAAAWRQAMPHLEDEGGLGGLVCAAGVLGPIGPLPEVSIDAAVDAITINLVGTMLALHFSVPLLQRGGGRAVTFSGGGATGPLPRYDAYAASKAAVVRLSENVAAGGEIEINSVAPGFVVTRMHAETLRAGPEAAGAGYHARTAEQVASGGFPAEQAAELVCFLLSEQARGISGRLISAQWDPWRDERWLARLRSDPDLARLRRIDDMFFTAAPGEGR
jgi:NAD(P)-dependent dehydrogenase (short-subunit alcohol dehydrogenase family)